MELCMRRFLLQANFLFSLSLLWPLHSLADTFDFPWCVAHRGYSIDYLENSKAAIEAAIQAGADAIELDIRHSYDGVALIHHDSRLKRTSKSKEGKKCKLNAPINSQNYKSIRNNCILKNDEELVTLGITLQYFTHLDQVLILEFKDSPSKKTLQILKSFQGSSLKLIAISFEQKVLDTLAQHELIYQDPIKLIWLTPIPVYLPDRFDGIGPFLISDGMIAHLREKQKYINVWTVDRSSKMKSLFTRGVHMITTNQLDTCLTVKRQLPKPA